LQPKFEYAYEMKDGLGKVCIKNKFGIINKEGKFVTEPEIECPYSDTLEFNEGLMKIMIKGKVGYLSQDGSIAIKPQFQPIVKDDKSHKCGYVNKKENFVIKPRFSEVEAFINGFAKVKLGRKWELINAEGKLVTGCI
jgi:hypothetical protein